MIPLQFALRRRMMITGWGGGANIAKLKPTPYKSYVDGVSGLSAAQLHEFAHLISNNANVTNSTTTVYVDEVI